MDYLSGKKTDILLYTVICAQKNSDCYTVLNNQLIKTDYNA